MIYRVCRHQVITFLLIGLFSSSGAYAQSNLFEPLENLPPYDMVIRNGRILDPATGRDEVINIGISNGKIVELSEADIEGKVEIEAGGYTVIPGFIDLHTHAPFPFGELLQVKDGVTTALELEAGAWPVDQYGEFIRGKARANFGSSVSHLSARIKVI